MRRSKHLDVFLKLRNAFVALHSSINKQSNFFIFCFLFVIYFFPLPLHMGKVKLREKSLKKKKALERTHVFQESSAAVNLWKTSVESKQDGSIILHENSEMA